MARQVALQHCPAPVAWSHSLIPLLDIQSINRAHGDTLNAAVRRQLDSGWLSISDELAQLRREHAAFCCCAAEYVGAANGIDARIVAPCSLDIGPGDEAHCSHGDIAAYSVSPGKNLDALGDGGAMTVSASAQAQRARVLSTCSSKQNYWHDAIGVNSSLDKAQGVVRCAELSTLAKASGEHAVCALIGDPAPQKLRLPYSPLSLASGALPIAKSLEVRAPSLAMTLTNFDGVMQAVCACA